MLSRVADSLYWMSRYLERAEHTTRLLDVNLNLMLDESASSADHRWPRLLRCLGTPRKVRWEGNPYKLASTLTFDKDLKTSVLSCVVQARENARHVREQISTEQWQRLNSLYLEVTRPEHRNVMQVESPEASSEAPSAFLQQVMEAIHQFQGITDSTMSHGEGWQFIQVGRFLERAGTIAKLVAAYNDDLWAEPERAVDSNEYLEWMGLLRSATAFEAYCKVYTADLTPERILEFLLLDAEFPHSLRFSIESVETALGKIYANAGSKDQKARGEHLHRTAGRLSAQLGFSGVDELLSGNVVEFLRSVQTQCETLHEGIYQLYVDYPIQLALAG
ncbi:MAG: alpha-E domain-containing protein [Janthinobacterium lividum]